MAFVALAGLLLLLQTNIAVLQNKKALRYILRYPKPTLTYYVLTKAFLLLCKRLETIIFEIQRICLCVYQYYTIYSFVLNVYA